MPSIVSANVRISSVGPLAPIRRDRSVAVMSWVIPVIVAIGFKARPATHQPISRLSANMHANAINE